MSLDRVQRIALMMDQASRPVRHDIAYEINEYLRYHPDWPDHALADELKKVMRLNHEKPRIIPVEAPYRK